MKAVDIYSHFQVHTTQHILHIQNPIQPQNASNKAIEAALIVIICAMPQLTKSTRKEPVFVNFNDLNRWAPSNPHNQPAPHQPDHKKTKQTKRPNISRCHYLFFQFFHVTIFSNYVLSNPQLIATLTSSL
jgi:hypothetical protein